MADQEPLLATEQLKTVPEWLYEYRCGITIAGIMWTANCFCAGLHLGLAIWTVSVAGGGEGGLTTPTLRVYLTNLTWVPDSTNALVPVNVAAGSGLPLAYFTLLFFLLSALAHGTICVGNYCQAFAVNYKEWREITYWTGWYYVWIHNCRQPLRWAEYSFSASVMIITIAIASGVAHLYMIGAIFALIWSTMLFGHFTEALSRPVSRGPNKRPEKWAIKSCRRRLYPHFLGYGPYLTAWAILMHSFWWNVSGDAAYSGDGGGPPSFVYIIVVGQFAVFTVFGFTQLFNQSLQSGPSWYVWGEFSYLVLSLFSKGLLGVTLVFNVLVYQSFDEAVRAAR